MFKKWKLQQISSKNNSVNYIEKKHIETKTVMQVFNNIKNIKTLCQIHHPIEPTIKDILY